MPQLLRVRHEFDDSLGLFFEDRVGWALWHTANGAHVGAAVARIVVDHIGLFSCVCADRIAWTYRAACIAHDAEVWFDCVHGWIVGEFFG